MGNPHRGGATTGLENKDPPRLVTGRSLFRSAFEQDCSTTYANEEEIHGGQQIGTCRSREGRRRGRQRQGQGSRRCGGRSRRPHPRGPGSARQGRSTAQRGKEGSRSGRGPRERQGS